MSTYEQILAECADKHKLFEDPEFPAQNRSVYYDKEDRSIVWKRPKEICDDPQFLVGGATRHDLDQGDLGDCWFLCAAATLSVYPDLFQQVIPEQHNFDAADYAGVFRFRFWRFGEWQDVVVDDRLPCKNNKPVFCKNREATNEFWSSLLEKAYAKVHGSYQALEAGYGHEALVDFTGGIGEFIELDDSQNEEKLFKYIGRIYRRKTLICATIDAEETNTTGRETVRDNGLVAGHAYSLTNLLRLDDGTRLLRLRNPWGKKEWTGPWSDGSSEWDSVPEEKREELGLTVENDGEFWITYADFLAGFSSIQLCHLTPDCVHGGGGKRDWVVAQHHGEWIKDVTAGGCGAPPNEAKYWLNPQYYVRLTSGDEDDDEGQCTVVVSLLQKYTRLKKTALQMDDTEAAIAFDVYRYRGDCPEQLDGLHADQSALRVERRMFNYEYLRERSFRFRLDPGVYCIMPLAYTVDREGEFLLRIATEAVAESGEIDEITQTSEEAPRPEERKFDRLFRLNAGDDDVVDARELRAILNQGLRKEKDEEFGKETCRSLIQSIVGDRRGELDRADCKHAWTQVRDLQATFDDYDRDGSGLLDASKLRQAFKSIGHRMSKKVLGRIVKKYCGKRANLTMDDFVFCAIKVASTQGSFERIRRRRGRADGKVELSLEELLEMTL